MSAPDRWATLQTLLLEALDLEPDARRAFLAEQDPDFADELAEFLAAADAVPEFLDTPAPWALGGDADHDLAGVQVGPYRLVRELGRGGQGRVFLARREDIGTEVALKLVRSGLAAPDLVPRFLAERRALGRLEHPHIARLLDAGPAETGPAGEQAPFFVMEAVDGVPLTDYVRTHRLPLDERLRLFLQVCDAVAYAHRQLVVHRDLKPTNILVSDDGGEARVKLLDFGIAKLLDDGADGETLTRTGLRLMTPEYAAPEQVLGQPIAVAADVYALGVLLYEVLTGERPYDVSGGLRDVVRAVCDEMPAPPSSRGDRALRGDLDTIVLRALAKAPEDRYATAEALASDLRRYQSGLPVQARRQTLGYQAARFLRRHALATVAAMLGVLLLMGFGVRERSLRVEAEHARVEAQATADLLTTMFDGFTDAQSSEERVDTMRTTALLDRAAAHLAASPHEEPTLHATLTFHLGRIYAGLDLLDRAARQYAAAAEATPPSEPALRADVWYHVAINARAQGGCEEALEAFREVVRLQREQVRSARGLAAALEGRSGALACLDRYDEAIADSREAQQLQATFGEPDGYVLHNFADVLRRAGRSGEAVETMRQSLAIAEADHPAGHPVPVARQLYLALLLEGGGREAEAEALVRRAYFASRGRNGPHHGRTFDAQSRLIHLLLDPDRADSRRLSEAESLAIALSQNAATLPPSDTGPRVHAAQRLAEVHARVGRLGEAKRSAREAVRLAQALPEWEAYLLEEASATLAAVSQERSAELD